MIIHDQFRYEAEVQRIRRRRFLRRLAWALIGPAIGFAMGILARRQIEKMDP